MYPHSIDLDGIVIPYKGGFNLAIAEEISMNQMQQTCFVLPFYQHKSLCGQSGMSGKDTLETSSVMHVVSKHSPAEVQG